MKVVIWLCLWIILAGFLLDIFVDGIGLPAKSKGHHRCHRRRRHPRCGHRRNRHGREILDEGRKYIDPPDHPWDWQPRWGYKRTSDPKEDWMLEVPDHSDPYEDQFEKRQKVKSERVSKNELQRLRNVARASKLDPGALLRQEKPTRGQARTALAVAQRSDASLGKFSNKVAREKRMNAGKRRKFESNVGGASGSEKERCLEIIGRLSSKQPKLNTNKAANKAIREEQEQRHLEKSEGSKSKKSSKGKNKRPGNYKFKGRKGGNKIRNPNAKGGGGGRGRKT